MSLVAVPHATFSIEHDKRSHGVREKISLSKRCPIRLGGWRVSVCGFAASRASESDLPHAANQTDGLDQSVGCTLRKLVRPFRYTYLQVGPTLLRRSSTGDSWTNIFLTCVTP